jgi:tetratricopeptide (TPR) repeat protein
MLFPQTEVIVSKDGVELARRVVTPGEYTIGRGGDVDFQMETPLASRHHAKLYVNYDEWLIEDLGSANGTFINDRKLPPQQPTKVFPTQTLRVGDATVTLRRLRGTEAPDASLTPQAATLHAVLPEEIRKDRRYAIGAVVAQGGMGAILNAQDQTIRRDVAMKVMLQSGGSEDVLRFVEEAQITGQLEHPNIVPVYELGVDEQDQPFYTMKFVRGISLQKVLDLIASGAEATVKKYPLAALLTIFQKVCDGIAFAHAKGVIHRDLKPANIMLGEYGEALVMDWGLAKVLGAQSERGATVHSARQENPANATLSGSIMGTPQYMAPEQAAGRIERLDARTDIYALGAILYHILTLRPPVSGESAEMVVERVRAGKIDLGSLTHAGGLPHLPDSRVPESLAAVVRKAMSLDPVARYASVKDLQADIEAYQGGFATSAEKAGAWKQFTLFVRRNKVAAIGVAAVLLIGTTFGTKAVIEGRRAKAALAELRGTAPTFAAQAAALVEAQKFDEALEKIGFALKLDSSNADYHLARAHVLQARVRLAEASESYRAALRLRPDDATAKANLDLCTKLLAENGGSAELTLPHKNKLLDAILVQKRQSHAVPLSHELKRDSATAETLIKSRLKAIIAQPGWSWQKLVRLADGSFQLDLRGQKVSDLSVLEGLPISVLDISDLSGLDLTPLRKVPLRTLAIRGWSSGSLEGLRGMKLTSLEATSSRFKDLSPLAGMPLERLILDNTPTSDLSPLRGMPLAHLDLKWVSGAIDTAPLQGLPLRTLIWNKMPARSLVHLKGAPLETLFISNSSVETLDGLQGAPLRTLIADGSKLTDISALRGSPLIEADLAGNPLTDLTPLAGCRKLERLLLPGGTSDIAFLQKLPKLGRIGFGNLTAYTNYWNRVPTAEEFWKKNGERLARQVPMEKQLEKFRRSLVAQGNEPDKVPRWAFDANGVLNISIPKELKVSDISELRGVAVNHFQTESSALRDLSPLGGAPLRNLHLGYPCGVSDLSPLRGAPLERIVLTNRLVRDISVLRGMPLRIVWLEQAAVTDIAPLADIPTLEEVQLPAAAKNIEVLRSHPRIALLSYGIDMKTNRPTRTAAEFWKEYDAKKAAGK